MEERILLKLIGVTYNQIESGVYAVILQEAEGLRRVPIVIGAAEAQAIECKLQEIAVPRPLTHDLMETMLECLDVKVSHVWLHQLSTGVFAADIHLETADGRKIEIDSRSSDAIALAVRIGCPIYTSEELIEAVGFEQKERRAKAQLRSQQSASTAPKKKTLQDMTDEELKERIQKASETENYEEAARLKNELDRRQKG